MDFSRHPLLLARGIAARYGSNFHFEFSIYRFRRGRSGNYTRTAFVAATRLCSGNGLQHLLRRLSTEEEIALRSRVRLSDGTVRHIPMIDFLGEFQPRKLRLLKPILPKALLRRLWIYNSGNSFHGYCLRLIDQEQWSRLMASLLLANPADGQAIVDWRWVGHRLLAGYAALRWSMNTDQYKVEPYLVGRVIGDKHRFEAI